LHSNQYAARKKAYKSVSVDYKAVRMDWIGLSSVLRPRQHSLYDWETVSTGQKTQPTVSKY